MWGQRLAVSWSFVGFIILQFGHTSVVAQPSSPNLPMGDISVLIVTDTHSWVGGHGDKEEIDADYGDVLSFFRQLKAQMAGKDLFFVMNGDWIDGTGLALNGDPSYLLPILERMPWDLVNCGNHELYEKSVIDYASRPGGFIEWWGSRYLSSNIVHSDNQRNFGTQYRLLKGPTSTVLAFGFLYNMKDNDPSVTVIDVEDVVQQDWFTSALQTPGIDAVLVLAHMGHDDELVRVILTKIREILGPNMPVQFVTGHTHIRGFQNPDKTSSSVEAGRYLDTVGFVSFPRQSTLQLATQANTSELFQHVFLDAKRQTLRETLNGPELGTEEGRELSAFIHRIQRELGLREIVGCVPDRYYRDYPISEEKSVWGLFEKQVVPRMFGKDDVVMLRTESARYDLLPGNIILDEIIAMYPFNETLYKFPDIPDDVLLQLNATLNANFVYYIPGLLPYTFASPTPLAPSNTTQIDPNGTVNTTKHNLITTQFGLENVKMELAKLYPQSPAPMPLDTTGLDIWIQFFREEHLCETKDKGDHRPSSSPWHHKNHTGNNDMGGFQNVSDEAKDNLRLIFALAAFGTVVLLGAIHAWQRGSNWRQVSHAREMATIEAWREYEGNNDDDDNELI